jgi:hypothetical protein
MSCPSPRYGNRPQLFATDSINRLPKSRLKFKNFVLAVEPIRSRRRTNRQRRTHWKLHPLSVLRLNGMQVEKFSFKSSTETVYHQKNKNPSRAYRFVCLSTFFRIVEADRVGIS